MAQIKFSKRHHIKEDKFVESIFVAKYWIQNNVKRIATIATILVIAVLISFVMKKTRDDKIQRAMNVFGKTIIAYENNDMTNSISGFKQIIQNFPKTNYAAISSFMLGSIYYNKKDYATAQKYYDSVIKKYDSYDFLKGASLSGLGHCFVQTKDYKKAIEYLDRFVSETPKHYLMPEVLILLGECHIELKNSIEAKKAFEKIIADFPKSSQMQVAKNLMATL